VQLEAELEQLELHPCERHGENREGEIARCAEGSGSSHAAGREEVGLFQDGFKLQASGCGLQHERSCWSQKPEAREPDNHRTAGTIVNCTWRFTVGLSPSRERASTFST